MTADGASHVFFGTLDGQYATFDALNGETIVDGINDAGYITGESYVATDDCPLDGCQFLRTPDGTIKEITRNKAPLDGLPEQIISHQNFIGQYTYIDQNNNVFFYGYYGKGPKYVSEFTLPFNTIRTRPRGLGEDGTVTGYYTDSDGFGRVRGFVVRQGVATAYDYPDQDAFFTHFTAVNKSGLIPGQWLDSEQAFSRAFLFDSVRSRYKAIDVSGATYASAGGINNAGLVTVIDDTSSYIYCPRKSTCPLHSPDEKQIPERWISAVKFSRTLPCRDGCVGPYHGNSGAQHDPAAVRAAIARDPELQRELRLPFRP
ncbi:MAG: hypothetical protein ACJ8IR_08460 [Alphaproteobacteria bacterium]